MKALISCLVLMWKPSPSGDHLTPIRGQAVARQAVTHVTSTSPPFGDKRAQVSERQSPFCLMHHTADPCVEDGF